MTRKNQIAYLMTAALLMLSILIPMWPAPAQAAPTPKPDPTPAWSDTYDAENPAALKDSDLQGASCVVIDADSGRILYDKKAKTKRYPASTTKIMTLLLALEYGHLDEMVTIPDEATQVRGDSSRVPVWPGEQMKLVDLLYGMMMRSGNDAANAVAVLVGGSMANFVDMMNNRAHQLGCESTYYTNPHGYHDNQLYSTAYDTALIAREGMKHKEFREIVSARTYTMSIRNPFEGNTKREKFQLETTNPMFVVTSQYYYPYANGIKTGFHSLAGQCFAGSSTKNGVTLISVTLKTTNGGRWMDTKRLMEYGYSRYQPYTFDELYSQSPKYVSIENAALSDSGKGLLALAAVPGGTINAITKYALPDEYARAVEDINNSTRVEYTARLDAPIREGDILGRLVTYDDVGEELSTTLVASRDVRAEATRDSVQEMFPFMESLNLSPLWFALGMIAVVILLLIVLRIRVVRRRNRRRREMYRRRQAAYKRYRSYD